VGEIDQPRGRKARGGGPHHPTKGPGAEIGQGDARGRGVVTAVVLWDGAPRPVRSAHRAQRRWGYGAEPLAHFSCTHAGPVATARQAPQGAVDLLQFHARGVGDGAEDVVVLALGHLLGEIGRQRIASWRAPALASLARLRSSSRRLSSRPYRVGIHHQLPPQDPPARGVSRARPRGAWLRAIVAVCRTAR
jgi:hypothetical protein